MEESPAERLSEPTERAETDVMLLRAVDDVDALWLDPETGDWVAEPTDAGHEPTRLSAPSVQRLIGRGELAERIADDRMTTRLTEAGRDRLRAASGTEDRYVLWSQAAEMIEAVEGELETVSPGARLAVELELLWEDGSSYRIPVTAPADGIDGLGEELLEAVEQAVRELDKKRYPLALSWKTEVEQSTS